MRQKYPDLRRRPKDAAFFVPILLAARFNVHLPPCPNQAPRARVSAALYAQHGDSPWTITWGKMLVRHPSSMVLALLVVAALPGCAGNGPQLPSLGIQSTSDSTSTASASIAGGESSSPQNIQGNGDTPPPGIPIRGAVGSATDIYSNIARGAMACWFAVNGPLKKDYIFHATADAPSRGGKAEVVIHLRDPTQPNPRGVKTYIVEIQPTGEASANVTVENRKMSDAYAAAMTGDISRWAKGEEGCASPSTAAGWRRHRSKPSPTLRKRRRKPRRQRSRPRRPNRPRSLKPNLDRRPIDITKRPERTSHSDRKLKARNQSR